MGHQSIKSTSFRLRRRRRSSGNYKSTWQTIELLLYIDKLYEKTKEGIVIITTTIPTTRMTTTTTNLAVK